MDTTSEEIPPRISSPHFPYVVSGANPTHEQLNEKNSHDFTLPTHFKKPIPPFPIESIDEESIESSIR